jgi:hypothetical protein
MASPSSTPKCQIRIDTTLDETSFAILCESLEELREELGEVFDVALVRHSVDGAILLTADVIVSADADSRAWRTFFTRLAADSTEAQEARRELLGALPQETAWHQRWHKTHPQGPLSIQVGPLCFVFAAGLTEPELRSQLEAAGKKVLGQLSSQTPITLDPVDDVFVWDRSKTAWMSQPAGSRML